MFTDPIFKLNESFLVWRSQAGFLFQDCIFLDYRSSQVYTGHWPNIIHWPYSYYLIPVYITRLINEIHLWKIWSKSINNVDSIPLAMHHTMQHNIHLCSLSFSSFNIISLKVSLMWWYSTMWINVPLNDIYRNDIPCCLMMFHIVYTVHVNKNDTLYQNDILCC